MSGPVALVKGEDRRDNIRRALDLIAGDIYLAGKSKILIKPNFVSVSRQLAATHVDAIRAVLDFLRERGVGRVTIGEGPASAPAEDAYRNFGYLKLLDDYDVRLIDLNETDWITVRCYDSQLNPIDLRVSRVVADADLRISVTPPKTHDCVIVTAGIKNLAVGSLVSEMAKRRGATTSVLRQMKDLAPLWLKNWHRLEKVRSAGRQALTRSSDKVAIHQGCHGINLNLYLLAKHTMPHVSIIDGMVGMEECGPENGKPVPMGMAVAGCDAVAVDCLTAHLMGFQWKEIGYLWYCASKGMGVGELSDIEIIGEKPEGIRKRFTPHPLFESMLGWRHPGVDRILAADEIVPGIGGES